MGEQDNMAQGMPTSIGRWWWWQYCRHRHFLFYIVSSHSLPPPSLCYHSFSPSLTAHSLAHSSLPTAPSPPLLHTTPYRLLPPFPLINSYYPPPPFHTPFPLSCFLPPLPLIIFCHPLQTLLPPPSLTAHVSSPFFYCLSTPPPLPHCLPPPLPPPQCLTSPHSLVINFNVVD